MRYNNAIIEKTERGTFLITVCFEGRRTRKNRKNMTDARLWVDQYWAKVRSLATASIKMEGENMNDAAVAFKLLEKNGLKDLTLVECATFVINNMVKSTRDLSDAYDDYIDHVKMKSVSPRHLKNVKGVVGNFTKMFDGKKVADVSHDDVKAFAHHNSKSEHTIFNKFNTLSTFFQYCLDREWSLKNPARPFNRPKSCRTGKQIFQWQEVKGIMDLALRHGSDDLVNALTLGFFAGLRTSEICRLRWEDIRMFEDYIYISDEVSKTISRQVDFSEQLFAWLRMPNTNPMEGKVIGVCEDTLHEQRKKLMDANNIDWISNAARKTFASYKYAELNDEQAVKAQIGHTKGSSTFRSNYYSEIKDPLSWKDYNAIMPQSQLFALDMQHAL